MKEDLKKSAHMLEECSAKVKKTTGRLSDGWSSYSGEIFEMKAEKICSELQDIAAELLKISASEENQK